MAATRGAGEAPMAAPEEMPTSSLRGLDEALGVGLTPAENAYYLEQVTITEASEDEYEYEEIPDNNFSIPESEEDLAKAIQVVQEQATDTQILEQKTVLPAREAAHEVIEDFLCNFLIKMGMTRTLDCFQSEWYELIQKGITELRASANVPDVYSQVMLLENENKNLRKDLKHYKQAADKAREELLKTQKERDFHRIHHKRILQEKNKLINDLKGLKLHYASYEPTIRVLHEKHHILLKEKMLTSLERDRAIGQVSGLQETLKNIDTGHICHVPEIKVRHNYEKENTPEGPTQKGLREAREQSKSKTKKKDNKKDSEFPINMQPDPNLNLNKEDLHPVKFNYKLSNIFRLHELPVSRIAVHPHDDILVTCGEDRLWKIVGIPKGNVILTGLGHIDWLSDCCFHPSGKKLATSSGDSTIKLWDLYKGDCILSFEGHNHAVWSCAWHSCGDFVASSSMDTTSKIWDVNSEQCRGTLYGHTDSVNSIEFFPFSNTLLTASADKTMSVWDARTGKCEQSLYGHLHSINDATFSPMGHLIASCDACGVMKLWDFRKLSPIVSIDIGPSPGNEVNFDPSGIIEEVSVCNHSFSSTTLYTLEPMSLGLSSQDDYNGQDWARTKPAAKSASSPQAINHELGSEVSTQDMNHVHMGCRHCGQHHHLIDHNVGLGRVLAQASGNGVIHLLDLQSGQIYKLMGHESEVQTVAFSNNSERLFSGGSDGTVRAWS